MGRKQHLAPELDGNLRRADLERDLRDLTPGGAGGLRATLPALAYLNATRADVVRDALAEAGIAGNVLAGRYHDHLLVPVERVDEAIAEVAFARMAGQNVIGRMHSPDEVAAAATPLCGKNM